MEKPFEKLKRFEMELKQLRNAENYSEIFNVYLKIGELCYDIDATELGIKYVEEAFELGIKQPQNFSFKHLFYKVLGNLYLKQVMLNEAMDAYKNCIKEISKNEDFETKAEIFFQMGRILVLQEKKKAGIKSFKDSEKHYDLCKNYANQARVLNEIGITYINRTSVDLRKQIGVQISESERLVLGRSNLYDDSLDSKARKSFKKALDILNKHHLLESEKELAKTVLSNLGIRQ